MPIEIQTFWELVKQFGRDFALILGFLYLLLKPKPVLYTANYVNAVMAEKDKQLADRDKQLEEWKRIANERGDFLNKALGIGERVVKPRRRED